MINHRIGIMAGYIETLNPETEVVTNRGGVRRITYVQDMQAISTRRIGKIAQHLHVVCWLPRFKSASVVSHVGVVNAYASWVGWIAHVQHLQIRHAVRHIDMAADNIKRGG